MDPERTRAASRFLTTAAISSISESILMAKKEKNFELADAIRAELLEKGVEIKDTREGVVWSRV